MTIRDGAVYTQHSPYEPPKLPTKREMDIIRMVASGMMNKEIAVVLGTTEHVVKNYLRVIYDKLGMSNRVEVAIWYVHHFEHPKPIRIGN